jgi:two-component system, LytTR family, sensor kinase
MAERTQHGNRNFIIGVWLTWTAIAVVSYARHYFEATHPFVWVNGSWPELLEWMACFYPWAVLTPFIFRLEERFPLASNAWKRSLGIVVLSSLVFCYLAMAMGGLLNLGIDRSLGKLAPPSSYLWDGNRVVLYFEEFFFWCTFCAACAIRRFAQFHRQATQLALEKSQLEASLRRAELENLRMRLNPHFLFNTLQNISVLTQQNPKLACQMLARLGDLLRAALRRNNSPETTVSAEMALVQDYLAVEKMRFGDRLTILVDATPESEQALIPSFLLQPLVENAIIHGLRGISQVGSIAMRSVIEGNRLVLTIADNGVGVPAELRDDGSGGIGLSSTRERLDKIFPEDHRFVIRKLDEGGTEVLISIPYRRRERSAEEKIASEEAATVDR